MANDLFDTVCEWKSYNKARETLNKSQKNLRIFLNISLFEFVEMQIFGLLSEKKSGNKFIVAFMDRYSKLTSVIMLNDYPAPLVVACFVNDCAFPCGIPH